MFTSINDTNLVLLRFYFLASMSERSAISLITRHIVLFFIRDNDLGGPVLLLGETQATTATTLLVLCVFISIDCVKLCINSIREKQQFREIYEPSAY